MSKGSFHNFLRAFALTCLLLQVFAGGAISTASTSGAGLPGLGTATAAESASGTAESGEIAEPFVPVVSASALSVYPGTIQGGMQVMGEITLNGPAPAGGAIVNLSSSTKTVSVPRTVTVF